MLKDIFTRLPRQRRTGIYSATQIAGVEALAGTGLRNPVRVAIKVHMRNGTGQDGDSKLTAKRQRTPVSLQCRYLIVSTREKLAHMAYLLAYHPQQTFIMYLMTCAFVDYLRRLPLPEILEVASKDASSSGESLSPSPRLICTPHDKMSQTQREKLC